jgi:peptidoglycan/xylan/chitin deacetylase (PgdA/CDA1 family)
LPAKAVVITIDDVYRQTVVIASQLLAEKKMVATFGVIAARTGEGEFADWPELLAARKLGMELVSHSAYHPDFSVIDLPRQGEEIRGAIKVLRNFPDFNHSLFIYPYGRYTGWTLKALHDNNVSAAFTTKTGVITSQSKLLELPRVKMHGQDHLNAFFYQWLKKNQTNEQYARRH